jgi:hypothetical protein
MVELLMIGISKIWIIIEEENNIMLIKVQEGYKSTCKIIQLKNNRKGYRKVVRNFTKQNRY